MLFSVKLQKEAYSPWKPQYIDYEKLKKLLKENVVYQPAAPSDNASHNHNKKWTEKNESDFVHQLDLELEKVYSFQSAEYSRIDSKITALENIIDSNVVLPDASTSVTNEQNQLFLSNFDYKSFQDSLEETLNLAQELDHFSRLNFTGFIKIVKKHDRLHPEYTVKPLLNVRLNELPFHSEDYSPLLYRISVLYNFLRENFQSKISSSSFNNSMTLNSVSSNKAVSTANLDDSKCFKSFKFWIHPDNLMEVKTKILRHLPVLIYNNNSGSDYSNDENDSIITSLYFDNSNFDLYNAKLLKNNNSPTLRLRWSGKLIEKPEIFLEKKLFHDSTDTEPAHNNDEVEKLVSIKLKEKYIESLVIDANDQTAFNKILKKIRKRSDDNSQIEKLTTLRKFVIENDLEPTLRCIYTRTAFQIPGDDRVRIIIDSDILFIREDSFDKSRPIRDPQRWHRTDIDSKIDNPYSLLRKGEFVKFPYSVMEITVQDVGATSANPVTSSGVGTSTEHQKIKLSFSKKSGKWIEELTSSHLVKEVPNFSKFIQGIASLHTEDDKLDILPFWLPELEKDIRKDPKDAYDEELKQMKERKKSVSLINKVSTLSSPKLAATDSARESKRQMVSKLLMEKTNMKANLEDYDSSDNEDDDYLASTSNSEEFGFDDEDEFMPQQPRTVITNGSTFHNFPRQPTVIHSKFQDAESEDEEVELPPGVKEPKNFIKNAGPNKVEAKVWLANERTFIRWLHTSVILFLFATTIQNSTKKSNFPELQRWISGIYFLVTLFILGWGYHIYKKRLRIITDRSGEHLDNIWGPIIVAGSLLCILVINFSLGLKDSLVHHELSGKLKNLDGNTKEYLNFFVNMVGGDVELIN
ncbi:vacuolar transporter chaperone [Saccharomycopsis crataegensis]|uniref:Vacuolar transporter chaperone n=1 Tax=Saccharomycopsis crataegensis TaxID=43959 RepID=A0AAV5QTX1_9ASCO|nr:vacuolar transporter chaperone [Saccharomycopsis crataegensis]